MRNVVVFIAVSCLSGILAAVGCSSSKVASTGAGGDNQSTVEGQTSSPTSGNGSTTGTTATTATTVGVGGGGVGGGGEGTGGATAGFDCTIPAQPPSQGSCVSFMTDAGVELDAGFDDAGNASATICNPVTNEGCVGSDVCGVDGSNMFYVCQPAGNPANVPVCGDCTADTAMCGVGGLCVSVSDTAAVCVQMCCTDADCGGAAGSCDMEALQTALPSGVGICSM